MRLDLTNASVKINTRLVSRLMKRVLRDRENRPSTHTSPRRARACRVTGVMRALASCSARVSRPHRDAGPRARTRFPLQPSRSSIAQPSLAAKNDASFSVSAGASAPALVYLVGAGPGGLDHITVKALRILRQCDAVVYDDLGGGEEDILAEVREDAELVYVGKRGGNRVGSWKQEDVNETLVNLSASGKTTCRLKGGCPSVFSRAREEMRALKLNGCPFELVPGVSSALAAPLSAGVPLTEKSEGKHFVVTSAHECEMLDFRAFAHVDTCVFLMVGAKLPVVVERLLRECPDKTTETPVLVIRWACTPREEIFAGTLGTVAEITGGRNLSPCVFVVGEVCAKDGTLAGVGS